jgi:hypothetical protein
MLTVTLQLPEEIAAKLAASSSDTATRVKVELALNLYSLGEITHAEACQLAANQSFAISFHSLPILS